MTHRTPICTTMHQQSACRGRRRLVVGAEVAIWKKEGMVEAAGVEPASESSGSLAPTCLALASYLVRGLPGERGTTADQPLSFRRELNPRPRAVAAWLLH